GALRSDCPFVRFHKRFADGQTQTQSAKLCPATLFKSIENFRQCFRLNSQSGIRDFDTQLSVGIVARGNGNLPLARCKFHRVIYQVPKNLLQSRRICSHMDFSCAEVKGTRQMLAIDFRLTNLDGSLQETMRVNDLKIELHLALIDARQIKQVIDQPRLQFHVAADHLQRFVNLFRQCRLALQCESSGEHWCKRRAQFVAEHGQKLVLRQIGARLFLELQVYLLQLRGERLRLFEQVFRLRACLNRIEHNADDLG